MENDTKTVDRIYLKPYAFDLVLEVMAGLLLLFLWGIALGKFVFPESYTDRFDQSFTIIIAIGLSLMFVAYYRIARYPNLRRMSFVKITEENAERQYRLDARMSRIFFIAILAHITSVSTKGIIPLEIIRSLRDVSLDCLFLYFIACMIIWYFVRSWMLR